MKLDNRIKELIAVGASITANCQPCLQYHSSEAQISGADEQDIMEAIEVGKMVRRGAAGKMDKFVASLSQTAAPSNKSSSSGAGGCPA
jgi:AhpD family alkylhydroperoxidase